MTMTTAMSIDGRAVVGEAPADEVVNPATEEVLARVPAASRAQLDQAVAAADRAFLSWREEPLARRREALTAFADAVRARLPELAALLTSEQGKPLAKAKSELESALTYLGAFAKLELPVQVLRETPQQRVELHHRPLGVVGAITAWNYPALLAAWKLGPALIAGNTVVLKPSPLAPLTTLRLGELAREVLPPGVLNVVAGGAELGGWMTEHPRIRKIAFTGSAATGKRIMASAAGTLKRLTLELGGNDAGLVLDDVDPVAVAPELLWAKFSNIGQVCAALKRLYVHERVYDAVCHELARAAAKVRLGPGTAEGVDLGPLQNRQQLARVRAAVADAVSKGARVYFQGEAPSGRGYFHPLTLLTGVKDGMAVWDDELFGPVLGIQPFRDEEEVLARANATEYGLGGSVWTKDTQRGARLAARLESGSQWVNAHPSMGPDLPFGGIKGSGLGVECGLPGLLEYTATQVLNVKQAP